MKPVAYFGEVAVVELAIIVLEQSRSSVKMVLVNVCDFDAGVNPVTEVDNRHRQRCNQVLKYGGQL